MPILTATAPPNRETLGQHDLALADYAQVIKLDPRNYSAYVLRSAVYFGRQSYNEAIADLTGILKFKPDDAYSYQARADAKPLNKQYENAVARLHAVNQNGPALNYGYYERAVLQSPRRPGTSGSRNPDDGQNNKRTRAEKSNLQ